ncbi:MAG: hypothetical protein ACPGVN_09655, partial [Alphaproteobacteria bacterium]
ASGCTIEEKSEVVHNNEFNFKGLKLGPKPGVSFRKISKDEYAIAVIGFRKQPKNQIERKFKTVANAACGSEDWSLEGGRGEAKKTQSALVGWEMSGKVVCLG